MYLSRFLLLIIDVIDSRLLVKFIRTHSPVFASRRMYSIMNNKKNLIPLVNKDIYIDGYNSYSILFINISKKRNEKDLVKA